jgi:hypothetical protein
VGVRDGRAVAEASSCNTSFGAARAGAGVARVPVLKSRCILAPLMMIGNASRARSRFATGALLCGIAF